MADVRMILIMSLISTNLFAFLLAAIIYMIGKQQINREFMRIFKRRGYMFLRITDLNNQFTDIVVYPDKQIKNNMLELKGKTYIINPKHIYFGSRNIPCAYIDGTKSFDKDDIKDIPCAFVDEKKCSTLPLGSMTDDDLPSPEALSRALELANMAGAMEQEKKRSMFVDIIPFIILIGIIVLIWFSIQTNNAVSVLTP